MAKSEEDMIMSRRQVEGLVADGKAVIIVDGMVLKLDSWLKYHPGGDKAIFHMLGRDATDEVNALHSREARLRMKNFKIGTVELPWVNFTPPIQGGMFRAYIDDKSNVEVADQTATTTSSSGSSTPTSVSSVEQDPLLDGKLRRRHGGASSSTSSLSSFTEDAAEEPKKHSKEVEIAFQRDLAKYPSLDAETQQNITDKYRALEAQLRKDGLFECNYSAYAWECGRYLTLIASSLYCLHTGWYKTSAVLLGCFWHQLTFTAHDAGHMGISHDFTIDTLIGIFIANFCGGLSLGWWKKSHNVHHIITNEPEHDPDIQHLPFLAVDSRFFGNVYSTYYNRILPYDAFARFMVQFQSHLYYPILCFGRFNLYRLSWEYLLCGQGPKDGIAWWHRWVELAGMSTFCLWFGYGILYCQLPTMWDRFCYVMISHIMTMPVHLQITLSHFAMSTSDMGVQESFPQRMMRTTMDVVSPVWLDFFHGGLQFQAVHHLFPRLPRHNLRRAQPYVVEFCKDAELPYVMYGFYEGECEVINHLAEIGRQATIFRECSQYCVENKEFGHF